VTEPPNTEALLAKVREARLIVQRHDSRFYGPMKGDTCGCEDCVWPRRYIAIASELELWEATRMRELGDENAKLREALRGIATGKHEATAYLIATAALAEIEWPDGDEVGQPTC
jgi:hypothetical protein